MAKAFLKPSFAILCELITLLSNSLNATLEDNSESGITFLDCHYKHKHKCLEPLTNTIHLWGPRYEIEKCGVYTYYRTGKNFNNLYDKPWARIGPYVIGFFAGYVLYITNCKLRIPRV